MSKFSNRLMARFSALGLLALGTAAIALQAKADEWDKKTVLTITEPIQINKIYLEPGTYVLKLLDSESDRHIVRIMNADETHLIGTELAIPNYRLQPTGKTRFQFWETPPGSVKALRAWFYPGDNFGQEFEYPKDLRTVSTTASSSSSSSSESAAAATPASQPAPAPSASPEPAPTSTAAAPAPAPQPAPSPAPVNDAPAPAPAPQPAPAPSELPQTATMFPLFGLSGLLAAMGYVALRWKRA